MDCSATRQRMHAVNSESRDNGQILGVIARADGPHEALFCLSLRLTFGFEILRDLSWRTTMVRHEILLISP